MCQRMIYYILAFLILYINLKNLNNKFKFPKVFVKTSTLTFEKQWFFAGKGVTTQSMLLKQQFLCLQTLRINRHHKYYKKTNTLRLK